MWPNGPRERGSSLPGTPRDESEDSMKKSTSQHRPDPDEDTLRPEYDFTGGVRGVTAGRYREGSNVVVVDPAVLDVFPDEDSVNEALRALAEVVRRGRGRPGA